MAKQRSLGQHLTTGTDERSASGMPSLSQALSELLSVFADAAELDQAIAEAVPVLGRFTGADWAAILRPTEEGLEGVHQWWSRRSSSQKSPLLHVRWSTELPVLSELLSSGESLIIVSPKELPSGASAERELLAAQGVRSLACMPICSGEVASAVLCCALCEGEAHWPGGTQDLLQLSARIIASALRRHEAERELRESERQVAAQQLHESETRLRLAMAAANEGFWEYDIPADEVRFDEAGARMIGFEPDEIKDSAEAWVNRIHPDDRVRVAAAAESCLSGQHASFNEEYRLVTKDGGYLWIAGSGMVARRDELGGPLILIGINRNIDAQKRNEMAANQARRLEAIGSLAGGIAHEFNNILAIILGAAEVSAHEIPTDHPAAEFLEEIRLTSLRGRDVVKQLLDYSGSSVEELKKIDAITAIRGAMKMLRASMPSELKIREEFGGGSTTIRANHTQIQQIIVNLVKNAADSFAHGAGTITLSVNNVRLDEGDDRLDVTMVPGDYFRLAVKDCGQGIPPENMARVFDPYFTTKAVGHGTGMGLAVVQRIVATHGGSIRIESHVDHGTAVRIYLPLCGEDHQEAQPTDPTEALEAFGRADLVALVDDEPAFIKYMGLSLQRVGFRVEGYTKADELLNTMRRDPTRFSAVVSDLSMPEMSGERLLDELRHLNAELPAILCSGYSEAMDPERAEQLGAAALMKKPFDSLELARTLRRVIDRR